MSANAAFHKGIRYFPRPSENWRRERNGKCIRSATLASPSTFPAPPIVLKWLPTPIWNWCARFLSRLDLVTLRSGYYPFSTLHTEAFMALTAPPSTKRIQVGAIVSGPADTSIPPENTPTHDGQTTKRKSGMSSLLFPVGSITVALLIVAGVAAVFSAAPVGDTPVVSIAPVAPPPTFADVVKLREQFAVAESKDVITVTPQVATESDGGFLVADAREAQIRRYTGDGELISHFGRRGQGPGEFTSLSDAIRLDENRLLASDMNGQLTTFTNQGVFERLDKVELTPLYGVAKLDDSTVVLMGRSRGDGPTFLVHLWDTRQHVIRKSFFEEPAHSEAMDDAYRMVGFPSVAVRNGQIAATFAVGDDIQLFNRDGEYLRSIPIPFRDFRQLEEPVPPSGSPEAFQRWAESFSVTTKILWMQDGSFLVQYFDKVGQEPQWRLLGMTSEGASLFEGPSPKLLAASSADRLLFDAPDADEPNVWQYGSISRVPQF
jgi:hypothetical protein